MPSGTVTLDPVVEDLRTAGEAALSMSELLRSLRQHEVPKYALLRLRVARSSLIQAVRELEHVCHAILPDEPMKPKPD